MAPFDGGAILNDGAATIDSSRFVGNRAARGGAINNTGTLTVRNTDFSNNLARYGGALFNRTTGTLIVKSSTFSGNSASANGGAIANGGIIGTTVDPNGGQVRIGNSFIFRNTAVELGGGMYNPAPAR